MKAYGWLTLERIPYMISRNLECLWLLRRHMQNLSMARMTRYQSLLQILSAIIETLSARTERAVESSHTIHVLAVLGLLLLPYATGIVANNFGVLGRAKTSKSHHGLHGGHAIVDLDIFFIVVHLTVFIHGVAPVLAGGPSAAVILSAGPRYILVVLANTE